MLRTRRRDNNVKPNRRLDRKSSRGMLYENEELRLKTININAEIERGQSDIKKLKRENEMLKKEIWCLRDEYDKLDKLLKDKKLDFSSSSTTYSSSSDTESCSSCTEGSEEVETSQNLKNVQKTNLKNIRDQFDHLSVVTEETSCENSEGNSGNRRSEPKGQNDVAWDYDKDVLKADQSYPVMYDNNGGQNRARTLPNQLQMNFFTPIQSSKSFDENQFNQSRDNALYPEDFYDNRPTRNIVIDSISDQAVTPPLAISPDAPPFEVGPRYSHDESNFLSRKMVRTNANSFYQNMVLVAANPIQPPETKSMEKKATDLIVKIDNKNFNGKSLTYSNTTPSATFSNGGNLEELLHDIESISQDILKLTNLQKGMLAPVAEPDGEANFFPDVQNRDLTYLQNPVMDHLVPEAINRGQFDDDKVHKSELNVVLMPKAMPLIGFDKYKNIERSFERLNSDQLEDASASQQDLRLIPPPAAEGVSETAPALTETPDTNPFFFGHFNDNYVNADYFNIRYNPDNFANKEETEKAESQPPVENDENVDLKTTGARGMGKSPEEKPIKSPKLSITRKVSIHFKGKKEKEKLKKAAQESDAKGNVKYARQDSKKSSIFDTRFGNDASREKTDQKDHHQPNHAKQKSADKSKQQLHQKTPSMESRKSTTETSNHEPKTPTSTDSSDKKTSQNGKTPEARKENERKSRKSTSVSPDRGKHVHVITDASYLKKHKKHRRERSGVRQRRASVDHRLRERSFSVCTDRSFLDSRLGLASGLGGFVYEDYSDRERTNSGSSCDSNQTRRKLSAISVVPLNGKVPWCGCWGNGCL